jgi:glucose uptake protein GlcU
MSVLMTLLIAGSSMACAVHQWWRGHRMIAIGFIAVAWLVAGAAIELAKNNQNADATEGLQQP